MTSLGTFAEALRAAMQTALNVELVPGVLSGRQKRVIGCVWAPAKARIADMAVDETIEAHMRIFLAYDASVARNTEKPWDPAPLYAYADLLQSTAKTLRTSLGVWQCSWESTTIDEEDQGLEAVFIGRQANLAETYG